MATLLAIGSNSFAQSSLTLASATAVAGGTVPLDLTVASPPGSEPAALQWTLAYPGDSVAGVNVVPGPAATAGGKTISCAGTAAGYTCILSGINSNRIANGVAATVTVTLTSSATTSAINLGNGVGAALDGNSIAVSTTGGLVTVAPVTPPPAVSSMVCSPVSLTPGGTTTCTVGLNAAAGTSGVTVALSSSSAALTAPASVAVPAGAATMSFVATAGAFSSDQSATLTASLNGSLAKTTLALATLPSVSSLQCVPANLTSGASASCTVTLSKAAPAGGATVSLASSVAALTVPASVSIPGGSVSAAFNATAGSIPSTQTAVITAALNGSSRTATVSLVAAVMVTSLKCSPTTLSAGTSAACTVTLSQAPAAATAVSLSDNSADLTVPSSISVAATSTSASFTALAGAFTANQDVVITAFVGSSSASATVALRTGTGTTLLTIRGDSSEVSGVTNNSIVTPAVRPNGFTGKVVVNGAGSVGFASGKGVYFMACCSNTANAYYKFPGSAVGNIFDLPAGEISLTLTSRYTFAQRTANANNWYAFDVRDGNGHQFYLLTSTVSGYLVFYYLVGGSAQYYFVPQGTEDQLFGNGVSLRVAIRWDGRTAGLYLNGVLAGSTPYRPSATNWNSASNFDLGAYEYENYGGFQSSQDLIRDFTVTALSPPPAGAAKNKAATAMLTSPPSLTGSSDLVARHTGQPERLRENAPRFLALPPIKAVVGIPLRFNVLAADRRPYSLSVLGLPAGAMFDVATGAFTWMPTLEDLGDHSVTFSAINALGHTADITAGIRIVVALEPEGPEILTVGDGGSDQALAVHIDSDQLALIPNGRFDGQPVRAGDSLAIYVSGIDCGGDAHRNVQLKFGAGFARITSLDPVEGSARVCRLGVQTPDLGSGGRTPISLQIRDTRGTIVTSNVAFIDAAN